VEKEQSDKVTKCGNAANEKVRMERETLARLFVQHYGKMQRVARTILYDEQAGEDVISDIFESLLRGRTALSAGTADWQDEACERYLLTSVRNRCLKVLRRRPWLGIASGGQPLGTPGIELAVAADAADDDALIAEIMAFAASHLSEQEQRILNQRFTHGLRYSEIATAEGISRVAVWKHLSHALNEIKKHFNPKML
jgi:RNA polymerase sigma-70 factor (ECF subfamily)